MTEVNDPHTILSEINNTRVGEVGNWASRNYCHKVSFCGWMDFHSDNGDGGATKDYKIFSIVPLYCHEDAWLVHKIDGKLVMEKPLIGKLIHFNAYTIHALLPHEVAKKCVAQNSTRPSKKMVKWSDCGYTIDTEIRLVWKWLSDLHHTKSG